MAGERRREPRRGQRLRHRPNGPLHVLDPVPAVFSDGPLPFSLANSPLRSLDRSFGAPLPPSRPGIVSPASSLRHLVPALSRAILSFVHAHGLTATDPCVARCDRRSPIHPVDSFSSAPRSSSRLRRLSRRTDRGSSPVLRSISLRFRSTSRSIQSRSDVGSRHSVQPARSLRPPANDDTACNRFALGRQWVTIPGGGWSGSCLSAAFVAGSQHPPSTTTSCSGRRALSRPAIHRLVLGPSPAVGCSLSATLRPLSASMYLPALVCY